MSNNYLHFTNVKQASSFPTGGNFIAYSELDNFEAPMTRRDVVGLKYVIKGEENYIINGERHRVKPGQLLVVDELIKGEAFNSKNTGTAVGICINIDRKLVNDVLSSILQNEEDILEKRQHEESYNFLLRPVPAAQLKLGQQLHQLSTELIKNPSAKYAFEADFFHTIGLSLTETQQQIKSGIGRVTAAKTSTRNELLKRMLMAREIIHYNFFQSPDVAALASDVGMSEFHFSRSFKKVFQLSPYQYILQIRMQKAQDLLKGGNDVSSTAYSCGFSDIYSFSKAYKKYFGHSPSQLSRN